MPYFLDIMTSASNAFAIKTARLAKPLKGQQYLIHAVKWYPVPQLTAALSVYHSLSCQEVAPTAVPPVFGHEDVIDCYAYHTGLVAGEGIMQVPIDRTVEYLMPANRNQLHLTMITTGDAEVKVRVVYSLINQRDLRNRYKTQDVNPNSA